MKVSASNTTSRTNPLRCGTRFSMFPSLHHGDWQYSGRGRLHQHSSTSEGVHESWRQPSIDTYIDNNENVVLLSSWDMSVVTAAKPSTVWLIKKILNETFQWRKLQKGKLEDARWNDHSHWNHSSFFIILYRFKSESSVLNHSMIQTWLQPSWIFI